MSHWRTRELTRAQRTKVKTGYVRLFFLAGVFTVAALFAVSHLVATWDIIEAETAATLCTEMVETYEQTDGEFGWPNCNHL